LTASGGSVAFGFLIAYLEIDATDAALPAIVLAFVFRRLSMALNWPPKSLGSRLKGSKKSSTTPASRTLLLVRRFGRLGIIAQEGNHTLAPLRGWLIKVGFPKPANRIANAQDYSDLFLGRLPLQTLAFKMIPKSLGFR
jgi:hypothetical protein